MIPKNFKDKIKEEACKIFEDIDEETARDWYNKTLRLLKYEMNSNYGAFTISNSFSIYDPDISKNISNNTK